VNSKVLIGFARAFVDCGRWCANHVARTRAEKKIYIPIPSWGNHRNIFMVCDAGFSYRKKSQRSDWRRAPSKLGFGYIDFCCIKTGFDGLGSVLLVVVVVEKVRPKSSAGQTFLVFPSRSGGWDGSRIVPLLRTQHVRPELVRNDGGHEGTLRGRNGPASMFENSPVRSYRYTVTM
jgi:hypothetical protein